MRSPQQRWQRPAARRANRCLSTRTPIDCSTNSRQPRPARKRRSSSRRASNSPLSPQSSSCRRGNAPRSCSAMSSATRQPRWRRCWRPALPVPTARSNAPARRSRRGVPPVRSRATTAQTNTATEQALVRRLADAWHAADVPSIVALLTEDALFTMPPQPARYVGREAIGTFLATVPHGGRLDWYRLVPTHANRQPAVAAYCREDGAGDYRGSFGDRPRDRGGSNRIPRALCRSGALRAFRAADARSMTYAAGMGGG